MKYLQLMIATIAVALPGTTLAQGNSIFEAAYEVTITNLTSGVHFTPIIVAVHTPDVQFFEVGQPPSQAIADLSESGDTGPLTLVLEEAGAAFDIQYTSDGLIGPGESRTVLVHASLGKFNTLSLAGMLLPTNDSFVAVNGLPLDKTLQHTSLYALGYDAGSELNEELCATIPGPQCGGEALSMGLGEGYVHISPGIQGVGDLNPADYDWRNPIAAVTLVRID